MGYPMTWQRFIRRNRLTEGDYVVSPDAFWTGSQEVPQRVRNMMGDLRRLEKDALDERAICVHIAKETGTDAETVAAVLKEFMSW